MIRIITDSASDFTVEEANKLGITIVPMIITFDDKEYLDGINLSKEDFFKLLIESSTMPKTSQVTPYRFIEVFEQYPDDEIICITMSSKLSGTYQSAVNAKGDNENIYVVDSLNVTVGENILVRLALKLINDGCSAQKIVKILDEQKKKIKLVALLDTLEYLKKGGRISPLVASIGTLLHIKPVIEIKNGEVNILGKARGSKVGTNKLREKVLEYGGINFDMPFATAYSGLTDVILVKYLEDSKDLYPEGIEIPRLLIGSTIGTHIGPGAIALAFFQNK